MALLLGCLKEIASLILYIFSGIAGYLFPLSSVNKNATEDTPIVFVHGWLTQNPLYFFLKQYLEKKGFQVYMTNFGLEAGEIDATAKLLERYIQQKQLKNVVLVGVSAGAIISLVYLQKLDGWRYVRKFISVGGPFRGAPIAFLAFFSKAGRQMQPNSNFVKELSNIQVKKLDKIVCLAAKCDELVPRWSSQLPGAKNVLVNVCGHVNLQAFSKEAYRLIAQYAMSS